MSNSHNVEEVKSRRFVRWIGHNPPRIGDCETARDIVIYRAPGESLAEAEAYADEIAAKLNAAEAKP